MLIVTGIGVGIATQSTVYSDDVDYWITPETNGGSSVLVDTDAPKFGSVHSTAERITGFDDVEYATPVLTHIVRLQSPDGTTEYMLAMGIVGNPAVDRVSGVATTGLTPGDPYYGSGNGTANWTGEMVFSAGAGSLLGVTEDDPITVRQPTVSENQSFSVAGVDAGDQQGSQFPIVVMQLSELQAITGADSGDQAEQILVVADSQAAQEQLGGIYPRSTVETRSGVTSQQVLDDELPLALSITAFLIAIIVGTLFVMTMTGLEISADRKQLATLAAIGLSGRSRFTLLAVQTTVVTLIGGLLGVIVGFAGLRLVNEIATRTLTSVSVATAEPFMIAYGLAVAVVIALLSMPYVGLLLRRVGTVSEVME
jgi:putative ABC transport system permease protein